MELPHFNKWVWIGIIAGAVALGLYLRSRGSYGGGSTTDSSSSDSIPSTGDLPNPYSTVSGSETLSGQGTTSYPYPVSGPPNPQRQVPPPHTPKTPPKHIVVHGNIIPPKTPPRKIPRKPVRKVAR